MRKKGWLAVNLALAILLLSGCVTQRNNPLAQNEATAVPGLAMNLYPAMANDSNADQVSVTLYFRYLDEPMLAPENRVLTVRRDESIELAIVRALLDGPSAGHSELRRLLPAAANVESVTSRDDLVFVTFDAGLWQDDVPANWAEDPNWQTEAPLQRTLAAQSITASLTERFPYTGVQILVHRQGEPQTNLRLENAYFLNGQDGLSEPLCRDETLLLTPQNTANAILQAWQQHDFDRLYRYIAEPDKPPQATVAEALSAANALADYSVSAGSVSDDGQSATLTLALQTVRENESSQTIGYPLLLTRENGVWKIRYAAMLALVNR